MARPPLALLVGIRCQQSSRRNSRPRNCGAATTGGDPLPELRRARSQPVALAFEDLHWVDPTSPSIRSRLCRAPCAGAAAHPRDRAAGIPRHGARASIMARSRSGRSIAPMSRDGGRTRRARHALSEEVIEGLSERTGGCDRSSRKSRGCCSSAAKKAARTRSRRLCSSRSPPGSTGSAKRAKFAQIGAVLGRDFTYALLRAVGGVDEPALQSALDRLADADLLVSEGAGSKGKYRFKHALIQDAAYDSLLKTSRQALHRRAADILVGQPEPAAAEPEVIAHHFTQAGLDELAIEWWSKAGDQALRR